MTVFWRPGCPYCSSLRRGLRRAEIDAEEINIWEHPEAAARVRGIANGNETVPTVIVGAVNLVNPSAREVIAVLHGDDPSARQRRGTLGLALRWIAVGAVVAASFSVDALGHHSLSWVLDGVALAVYVAFRLVQR